MIDTTKDEKNIEMLPRSEELRNYKEDIIFKISKLLVLL
ncbi:hypothetical protein SAMN06265376_11043 [Dokdonia pacifica]|uniref:Uncharacterized protein n=1 Tax=Dokdonia pacifica TaxID=1627892 RepID=A0A239DA92_9FLAO|nr:hypothetical protein SAMN06265376_11043 [Dokdonia pacifica]